MAKRGGAKEQLLREFVTAFAITIGIKVDKKAYNNAWRTLWQRIARIELFKK